MLHSKQLGGMASVHVCAELVHKLMYIIIILASDDGLFHVVINDYPCILAYIHLMPIT